MGTQHEVPCFYIMCVCLCTTRDSVFIYVLCVCVCNTKLRVYNIYIVGVWVYTTRFHIYTYILCVCVYSAYNIYTYINLLHFNFYSLSILYILYVNVTLRVFSPGILQISQLICTNKKR